MLLRSLQKHFLVCILIALVVAVATPQLVSAFKAMDIGIMFLQFFARITGWAGVLLNMAIMELVFDMGDKVQRQFGASLESSWSVVRDFMNLGFIFALVYIGFKVILDGGTSAARNLLPRLIIAALLINFSLFFTKVIIDFSNLAAVSIYTSVGFAPTAEFADGTRGSLVNIGVSGAFMQVMGLKDLLAPRRDSAGAQSQYEQLFGTSCTSESSPDQINCHVTSFVFFLVTCIFFMIAAYAFFIGAFMLVTRFIILIILMILSPLMFAGYIFPQAQRFASRWWGTFLNAAFFAPAYLMMLYIAYMIASKVGVVNNAAGHTFFSAAMGSYEMVDVILNFIIVSGFLIAAVSVAKQMSFYGSNATLGLANNIKNRGKRALYRTGGFAAGAGVGAAAYGMRSTVGAAAYDTAEGNNARGRSLKERASGRGVNAWLARRQLDAAKKVSESSFDARQLMSKDLQKNLGTGKKGGYAKSVDEYKKSQAERADRYAGGDDRIFTDYDVADLQTAYKAKADERDSIRAKLFAANDPVERRRLNEQLQEVSKVVSKMEKGELHGSNALSHAEAVSTGAFAGDEAGWIAYQKEAKRRAETFSAARKAAKNYGKRRYAENLKQRYDDVPVLSWFKPSQKALDAITSKRMRDEAADAILKKTGQSEEDKLMEKLKKLSEGGAPAPAPAPEAT